jgi:hypothetical protein
MVRKRLFVLLRLAVGLVLAACDVPHPPCDLNAIVYPEVGRPLYGRTQLGTEYATAYAPYFLAPALAVTRASLAKINDVRWGDIAPDPPTGGDPDYQWNAPAVRLDDRVKAYQQAGFDLVIVLRARSSWGQAVWPTCSPSAASRPKPEYETAYRDWVQAVVERYDADGVDDMPGLLRPVLYYEIESEAQHWVYWQGVTDESWTQDYLDTLRLAAAGARAAYPQVQIILSGVGGGDVFDGFPTADELRAVIEGFDPQVRDALCGGILFVQEVIQARDAYDLIEFHALSDDTGLYGETAWLTGLLDHYGLPETPVWAGDATSAPALTGDPQALKVHPLYPENGEELFRILDTPEDPQHAEVEAWYRKEQAELAVKKFVVAAELGLGAIMMGLEQDWAWARNPAFGQRDFAYQGLVDTVQPFQVPDPRPAALSLGLLAERLAGYTAVQRLTIAPERPPLCPSAPLLLCSPAQAYAYHFTVEGQSVHVLWYDDGVAQLPWEAEPEVTVALPVASPVVTVTHIITQAGQTEPVVGTVEVMEGQIVLTVTETPMLVEEQEQQRLYLPFVLR